MTARRSPLLPALRATLLPAMGLLLLTGGCRVHTGEHGDSKDVDVGTPFGSVHVQHDGNTAAKVGLTAYPGASAVREHGENSGSADVNLNFGNFKLGVHATELLTPDPQDKVLAFYRKDMARYGTVVLCRGEQPVGQPTRTAQGLACDSDHSHTLDEGDNLQLRAGSPQHQHAVGVHTENGETHIALVALDLPAGMADKGPKDDDTRE